MTNQENTARLLPDVAVHAQPHLAGALDWVGMAEIHGRPYCRRTAWTWRMPAILAIA